MADDSVPPLTAQGYLENLKQATQRHRKDAQANIRQLTQALGEHDEWMSDLQKCADVAQAGQDDWYVQNRDLYRDAARDRAARAEAGKQGASWRSLLPSEAERSLHALYQEQATAAHDLHLQSVAWFVSRYWRILISAQVELNMPATDLAHALTSWLGSSWEGISRQLEGLAFDAAFVAPTGLDVIHNEADVRAMLAYSPAVKQSLFPFVPLLAPPSGMDIERYLQWVSTSIRASWSSISPTPDMEAGPLPGDRRDGRTSGPRGTEYLFRVRLYTRWRKTPTAWRARRDLWKDRHPSTWGHFIDAVLQEPGLKDWLLRPDDAQNPLPAADRERYHGLIQRNMKKAIGWAAPAPHVPATLAEFARLAPVVCEGTGATQRRVSISAFTPTEGDIPDLAEAASARARERLLADARAFFTAFGI